MRPPAWPIGLMKGTAPVNQVHGMKHRAWLILSLAAYFGLITPLCTYVCFIEASGTHSAAPAQGSDGSHHFADEHSDPPHDDRPFDHEWDCDEFDQDLLAKGERPRPTPTFAWTVPTASRHRAFPQVARVSLEKPEQASLPPPDVLLLKSTLLI